ncbi:hypothetical protein G1C96_1384 [Bifidobacterium sp. DSM 109958]|uniref:Uncharacterized protein n=1 Tax=Bifidobacterium moraviense TaxID=2675323 RepID=A0A7Y0I011_9BIFI|nr:hypothetical protein [Bifidobacterium sp. DSM 109958]
MMTGFRGIAEASAPTVVSLLLARIIIPSSLAD